MNDRFYDQLILYIDETGSEVHLKNNENINPESMMNIARKFINMDNPDLFLRRIFLYTSYYRDYETMNSYGIVFELASVAYRFDLTYDKMKEILIDFVNSDKIMLRDNLNIPIKFNAFIEINDPRIIRLESLRLFYIRDFMLLLPDGFSFINPGLFPNDHLPINKEIFDIITQGTLLRQDIMKITIKYTNHIYEYFITLFDGNVFGSSTIDYNHIIYAIDEILTDDIILRNVDMTGYYFKIELNDPTIEYYNGYADLAKTYIEAAARPILPYYLGDNPQTKIIMNRIGCNANITENNQPIDPIDLQPIPDNLLVTAVPINYNSELPDINNQSFCFNAKNLWAFWIQSSSERPRRPAINPLNNLQFDEASILYVKNLIEQIN